MTTQIPDALIVNPASGVSATAIGGRNILPNSQWQLWAEVSYINKINPQGTGGNSPVAVSGFTPTSGAPVMACANTADLKNGDLVIPGAGFQWGYAIQGYKPISGNFLTANRITEVVANTQFRMKGNIGGVSPAASAATSVQPICPGDNGSGGQGATGWLKSTNLACWADDYAVNSCPGALRTLGLKKTGSTQALYYHQVPKKKIRKYVGRTMTFGVLGYHKIKGNASTWRVGIDDGVSGIQWSTPGTGPTYSNPKANYNAFELLKVTATISPLSTALVFYISLDGATSDTLYVALPTALFGPNMTIDDLGQPEGEKIQADNHWNPPLLTPLNVGMTSVEIVAGSGLYGFNDIDLEAISLGTAHSSLASVDAKIEWLTGVAGAYIFCADHTTNNHLIFGPQTVTITAGLNNVGQGEWPLYMDGTVSLFVDKPQTTLTSLQATFDFWSVRA